MEHRIGFSKKKLVLYLFLALVLVALCIWMLLLDLSERVRYISILTKVIAVVGLVFFGGGSVFLLTKLLSTKGALIINKEGVFDNSAMTSVGFIKWEDVARFWKKDIQNNKCILVLVKNPEQYFENEKNFLKRKSIKMNYQQYGSPIIISENTLKIKRDELIELLRKEWRNFKKENTHQE